MWLSQHFEAALADPMPSLPAPLWSLLWRQQSEKSNRTSLFELSSSSWLAWDGLQYLVVTEVFLSVWIGGGAARKLSFFAYNCLGDFLLTMEAVYSYNRSFFAYNSNFFAWESLAEQKKAQLSVNRLSKFQLQVQKLPPWFWGPRACQAAREINSQDSHTPQKWSVLWLSGLGRFGGELYIICCLLCVLGFLSVVLAQCSWSRGVAQNLVYQTSALEELSRVLIRNDHETLTSLKAFLKSRPPSFLTFWVHSSGSDLLW